MRKHIPKIVIIFLILIGVVAWGIRYIYFGSAPKSKASGETVSFIVDPSSVSKSSGDFAVSVKVNPSINMTIRGYSFSVSFNASKMQVKSIQYKLGTVSSSLGDDDSKIVAVNQNGKVTVVGEFLSSTGQLIYTGQNTEIVNITFTSTSALSSSITTGSTDTKFYMIKADYTLEEKPSAGPVSVSVNGGGGVTPSATPTPTITSTPPSRKATEPPVPPKEVINTDITPDVGTCPKRSSGDTNCDGQINDADFLMFKSVMSIPAASICTNCSADFNSDGKVNLVDYEIWRNSVYQLVRSTPIPP